MFPCTHKRVAKMRQNADRVDLSDRIIDSSGGGVVFLYVFSRTSMN